MTKLILVLALLLYFVSASAQTQTISGTIIDKESGVPLPGVTIIADNGSGEAQTNGVISDFDGNYSIDAASSDILQFSFIGYETVEIKVGSQTKINVEMELDVAELEEVVVVGYGTLKKYDVTGSISSVGSEELAQIPAPSFDAALQGQAAGVQVSQAGGVPGGAVRILVRGTNSISARTEPLIIMDGMPISSGVTGVDGIVEGQAQSPLAAINPNDIENIQILKDAAATAVYGSRGANGVIIITTKSGKAGQGSTNISFTTGVTDATNLLEYASTDEWFRLAETARASNLTLTPFSDDFVLVGQGGIYTGPNSSLYNLTVRDARNIETDWMDLALQQGSFNEINLSTNRGFDKGHYFVSGNYRAEDAVYIGGRFERYSVRSNVEFEPVENLKVGAKITGSVTDNDRPLLGSGFRTANGSATPFFPVFDDNGEFFWPFSGQNIGIGLDQDFNLRETKTYRSIGITYAQFDAPWVDGLSLRTEFGYDIYNSINSRWQSELLNQQGTSAGQNFATGTTTNYNLYGTFDRYLTDDHYLNVVVGVESTQREVRSAAVNGLGEALRTDIQEPGTLGDNNFRSAFAGISDSELFRGYFGRLSYKYKNKYIINGSFRRDGSSRFLEDDRWQVFPAMSFGWIMSDEQFMSKYDFISSLKLRASFGTTGNNGVPARIGQQGFIEWGFYGAGEQGIILSNLPAQIGWETTTTYEGGLDFGFLDNRISGSLSYFFMDVNDLLLEAQVPGSFGAAPYSRPSVWGNIGDLDNSGFELEISTINFDTKDFEWRTSFNLSTNNNEIKKLTQLIEGVRGGIISNNFVSNEVGGSLATFFLPRYAGIDDQGREQIYVIDQETGQETGEIVPLVSADQVLDNRQVLEGKTGLPTYWGGIQNNFTYKDFEFSFLFSFQGGNYLLDRHREANSYLGNGNQVLQEIVTDSWLPNETENPLPRQLWTNVSGRTTTTRFLYKGDFIRLRNVQLAYNIPQRITSKAGIKSARVFVSGQNLLTFTQYPGADPEILNVSADNETRNLQQGLVGSAQALPRIITLTAGFNVTF